MDQENNSAPESTPIIPNAAPTTPTNGSMGPLIGSIVVIIILVVGAIYFWGSKLTPAENSATEQQVPEQPTAAPLSSNNDDASLEADLMNTPDVEIDTNF